MEEQFFKEAKEGWRRGESPRMKEQAVRIRSIHHVEFLWQSTATLEQMLESKKEQKCPSQETKEELPGLGKCTWRDANVCSTFLAHGGLSPKK